MRTILTGAGRRQTTAIVFATALVLIAATPGAAATTWPDRVVLGTSGSPYWGNPVFAPTGPGSGVVVYTDRPSDLEASHLYFRRTEDGGVTWTKPEKLSGDWDAAYPSIASDGHRVYVVWLEGGVKFRRSVDGGLTWQATKGLAPHHGGIGASVAARDGRVAVTWTNWDTSQVLVRVSGNNGRYFSPVDKIGTSTGGSRSSVAYGDGVLYVAWWADGNLLKLRRSTNNALSWKPTVRMDNYGNNSQRVAIAADGARAVLAYGGIGYGCIRTRTTLDSGAHWFDVAYQSCDDYNGGIALAFAGGSFQLAYSGGAEGNRGAFYRSSSTGYAWTNPQRVVNGLVGTSGVGELGGRALVFYSAPTAGRAEVRLEP